MNRIYIAGCGGMLGRAVYNEFSKHDNDVLATDIDLNEKWLEFGNVIDYKNIKKQIFEFNPDVIINLAAKTDLEWCELHKDETYKTNALGAENLGLIANLLDILCIFISTAGIFDGKKELYTEFDIPNPLNTYGLTKFYGEQFTLQTVKKHYVLRAGWMMGGGFKDKKFISKIYKKILQGEKELFIVDDKFGTPTYTKDFASNMYKILEQKIPYGLYNMVCEGNANRYEVAKELVKLLKKEEEIKINKVESDYWDEEYFAIRPESEKLKNLKLISRGANYMRDWRICLKEYVNSESFREITQ